MVLASASPARRGLLLAAGIDPEVVVSDVDEAAVAAASGLPASDACGITLALARAKAGDVAARIATTDDDPVLVVAADTMLRMGEQVLGKARDAAEVRQRWSQFAGRWAEVVTGHYLMELPSGRAAHAAVVSRILAAHPSAAELTDYIATGEPLAAAGSATIDGLGAAFVAEVEGDYSNVIGLSLPRLRLLVGELGYGWTQLWRPELAAR